MRQSPDAARPSSPGRSCLASAGLSRGRGEGVFVTGVGRERGSRRPSWSEDDDERHPEDHPRVLARHPLRQAGAEPVERPAGEGRASRSRSSPRTSPGAALMQSLHVRPVLDVDGKETGMFEVPAGGRRFRALELLVKQKRLARTAPVPCVVRRPKAASADEVSLAENIERDALHPLDQFRAFQAMRDKGLTEEAIAARVLRRRRRGASSGCGSSRSRRRCSSSMPRRHDARAAHGLHRVGGPRPPGTGLGGGAEQLAKGGVARSGGC